MSTLYIMNFTDSGSKPPFVIHPYTSNGPVSPTNPTLDSNAVSANTTLLLYGKGMPEYGERVQENLLHLLENFCNNTSPVYPTKGQLWYDSSVDQLKVYNGATWVSAADDYVLKSGDTMTGLLILSGDPVVALGAATKQYVDTVQTNLDNHELDDSLHLTVAQNALLDALPGALTAVELGYVDGVTSPIQTQLDGKVDLAGDTMTGFLILNADPVAALGAATKQYVDAVAGGGGGSTLTSGSFDPITFTLTLNSTPPSSINVDTTHTHGFTTIEQIFDSNFTLRTWFDNLPIITADTGLDFFEIDGDFSLTFFAGLTFDITGSTGNDGSWVVLSSSYNIGTQRTQIDVTTPVLSAVADGVITFPISSPVVLSIQHGFDAVDSTKAPITNAYLRETTTLEVVRPIIGVSPGLGGTFTIAGDYTALFIADFEFNVLGSTGNDDLYTTASSIYSAPNTIITVNETILSGVADGNIIYPQQPTIPSHAAPKSYVDQRTTIERSIQTGAGTTTPEYVVGDNDLWVFVNGIKWYLGDGYSEVGTVGDPSTTISWITSPSGTDRVEFLVFFKK